jgi:hypothetical protein
VSTVPFRATNSTQQGQASQASPDSLITQLRERAAEKRADGELTVGIPGRWEGTLRVVYGYVDLDELEGYANLDLARVNNLSMSLDMLSKAVKRIEALNRDTDEWQTVSDAQGPVTFDDRFSRLLGWPRPDQDYEFSVRQVFEGVFSGNGLAIGQHVGEVATWMGVVVEEENSGKASTPGGSTLSQPAPPSG